MTKKLTPEDLHLWHLQMRDVKPLAKTPLPYIKPQRRIPPPSRASPPPKRRESPLPTSPLPQFNRKELRHFKIEGRLDMHGLTLETSYAVLENFLLRAQEKKLKNILIITGKGETLRKEIPRWLEETALRHFVISLHSPAKLVDGGAGAFYIKVRQL